MSSDTETIRPSTVLDSNVVFSGLAFPSGNPRAILNLLRAGEIYVVISLFILEEVSRNWREKLGWNTSQIERSSRFLHTYCTIIDPAPQSSLRELSPEDNRIIDCAIQGQVQYLVTGDRGILQLKEYQGIIIINPADFLAAIRQG